MVISPPSVRKVREEGRRAEGATDVNPDLPAQHHGRLPLLPTASAADDHPRLERNVDHLINVNVRVLSVVVVLEMVEGEVVTKA